MSLAVVSLLVLSLLVLCLLILNSKARHFFDLDRASVVFGREVGGQDHGSGAQCIVVGAVQKEMLLIII